MALLGLFCSFKKTVNYLPGVEIDRNNLIDFCRKKNKNYIELCDENVCIENITNILKTNVTEDFMVFRTRIIFRSIKLVHD
jgi:hypothetical protein